MEKDEKVSVHLASTFQRRLFISFLLCAALIIALELLGPQSPAARQLAMKERTTPTTVRSKPAIVALPVTNKVPEGPKRFVRCDTSVGSWDVEIMYDWAPEGARRMAELVDLGYFTNLSMFRVPELSYLPIAQFGPVYNNANKIFALPKIPDDKPVELAAKAGPSYPKLDDGIIPHKKGYFAYGGIGPNSRTVWMWVSRADFEGKLRGFGRAVHETPVARVVNTDGLASIDRIGVVGDPLFAKGPDSQKMQNDPTFRSNFPGDYIRKEFPQLSYFKQCAFVDRFGSS